MRNRLIVLELCAGTLQDVCDNKYKGLPLPPDEIVLYQIAYGLNYIHSMKLVHRDIKPANILISSTNPVVIKISDFGLSKPTSDRGTFAFSSGIKGSWGWIAPEVLAMADSSDEEGNAQRGSVKSDVFSTGCVFFYFLMKGIHPFNFNLKNILDFNAVNLASEKNLENQSFSVLKKIVIDFLKFDFNVTVLREDHFAYSLIGDMIKKVEDRTNLDKVMKQLLIAIRKNYKLDSYSCNITNLSFI